MLGTEEASLGAIELGAPAPRPTVTDVELELERVADAARAKPRPADLADAPKVDVDPELEDLLRERDEAPIEKRAWRPEDAPPVVVVREYVDRVVEREVVVVRYKKVPSRRRRMLERGFLSRAARAPRVDEPLAIVAPVADPWRYVKAILILGGVLFGGVLIGWALSHGAVREPSGEHTRRTGRRARHNDRRQKRRELPRRS